MGSDDASSKALRRNWFHILLALADAPRHGYAIREDVRERTDGAVELYPATLYGSIRDLTEAGLIEPLVGDDDPDDDQRRRYYALTEAGRSALRDEVTRLQGILDEARASRALGGA